MNLANKADRLAGKDPAAIRENRRKRLVDEKRIKAVTVCVTDLEGRLHRIDYDKGLLLEADGDLPFDSTPMRGFSAPGVSDLRLAIDWPAFYWLPADVFGPAKVLVFGRVRRADGAPYPADMRARLQAYAAELRQKRTTAQVANEIEGFIFAGRDAERRYAEAGQFEYPSTGGYYGALPGDVLRRFIDAAAEAQRALGFANEKDHPEVAPSQFELSYGFTDAPIAADQAQLCRLVARQVATRMGLTASFLPKPVTGVGGSGCHLNLSISSRGRNCFHDPAGEHGLSAFAWSAVHRILAYANDICLIMNSSVNSYRRLDPRFEAPHQIRASARDRGAMIRIPVGNEPTCRIEVRSIAPDANPYLTTFAILKTGLEAPDPQDDSEGRRHRTRHLPHTICDAIRIFKGSGYAKDLLGPEVHGRYAELKLASAERSPALLGTLVKRSEVQFHHEVTSQYLWSRF
jgi:glutamine synthetase